jgi:chemotaxis protein histidine kinase CheA
VAMGLDRSLTQYLLVIEGAERFAIPQTHVHETFRLPHAQATRIIGERRGVQELLLKGSVVPLFRLADLLGIPRTFSDGSGREHPDRRIRLTDRRDPVNIIADDARQWDERLRSDRRVSPATSTVHVVVAKTNNRLYGLVVDEIIGVSGLEIKPAGRRKKPGKGYLGTAVLGDGRTAFVLDPVGLAILAGIA